MTASTMRSARSSNAFSKTKRGFALALVLWAVAFMGAIGLSVNEHVRTNIASSGNRSRLIKAKWIAEGCASFALAQIDSLLAAEKVYARESVVWWRLNDMVRHPSGADNMSCNISLRPEAGGLDINTADSSQLIRAFQVFGIRLDSASYLVREILERRSNRDSMEVQTFGSVSELNEILAFATLSPDTRNKLEGALSTEPGPYSLLSGQESGFRALPGIEPEAVIELANLRREIATASKDSLQALLNISSIAARIKGPARDSILVHLRELSATTAVGSDAWVVEIAVPLVAERGNAANYNISLAIRRIGNHTVVVRQRMSP